MVKCRVRCGPITWLFFLVLSACAVKPVAERSSKWPETPPVKPIVQLSSADLADPDFAMSETGEVWITGTGSSNGYHYVRFRDEVAFRSGDSGKTQSFHLYHPANTPGGKLIPFDPTEVAWSLVLWHWPSEDVLYASVMSPPPGKSHARWPEDNPHRRIYAFHQTESGEWVREKQPLFGGARTGWKDHCYDPELVNDEKGNTWLYYAKVSEVGTPSLGQPHRTKIFVRQMLASTQEFGSWKPSQKERVVLGVGPNDSAPYPSTLRIDRTRLPKDGLQSGTLAPANVARSDVSLVEGPRVTWIDIPVKDSTRIDDPMIYSEATATLPSTRNLPEESSRWYVMGFSAGDFEAPWYGIHFALSRQPEGPFIPLVTRDRKDLVNFSFALGLTGANLLGVGRPNLYRNSDGTLSVLVHAAAKVPSDPNRLDLLHRSPFIFPLLLTRDSDGALDFRIPVEGTPRIAE